MNTEHYCKEAANWWASKIEEKNGGLVLNLDFFVESLASIIKLFISKHAHMVISTYEHDSNLLDEIAFITKMPAVIPKGYEMKISYITGASVYDSYGSLLAHFS